VGLALRLMQFTLRRRSDTIRPDLVRLLRQSSNPAPALQAAGLAIVAIAQRAFDEPSLRPSAWAARKRPAPHRLLKRTGTLWRSIRIIATTSTSVTVGTDRPYAQFHQLGTRHMPARPFFPFTPSGAPTPAVAAKINAILEKKLAIG
jgi:phage gpG-like protein